MASENISFLRTIEIREAIKRCRPNQIAVAYIGADWKEFVRPEWINEIIVSPTLGSNPFAIEELAKEISLEKIHFLDSLHAKIYLGADSVVVGSSNLTKNGLDVGGLEEACVEIKGGIHLFEIGEFFKNLRSKAINEYPDSKAKRLKIEELKSKWNRGISHSVIDDTTSHSGFENYEPNSNDDFYIAWYQELGEYKYSKDVDPSMVQEDMHFSDKDNIRKDKWILFWRVTDSNKVDMRKSPDWMYVHDIHKNGVVAGKGYPYPVLAFQRKDLKKPPPPFKLNKNVLKAFKTAIESNKFNGIFSNDKEPFLVKSTFSHFIPFIQEWKSQYRKF